LSTRQLWTLGFWVQFKSEGIYVLNAGRIKQQTSAAGNNHIDSGVCRAVILLCFVNALSGCTSALNDQGTSGAEQPVAVEYVAREWSGHGDGRLYGGVVNPTGVLSGTLGSYRGCLVETRSKTLIVLTGAMDFHATDDHSVSPHVYSKSILGDQPASIIPLGSSFTVAGIKLGKLPDDIRLDAQIPEICRQLGVFLTASETLKLK
jgi:hypothetical protein